MFSTEVHQIQCFWNALLEAGLMADTIDENHKEIIICSRLFQNLSVNHSGFNQSVIDSMFDKGELYLDSLSQILVSLGKLGYSVKLITENSVMKWDLGNNKKFDDEHFMFKELKSCENISLFWNESDIDDSFLITPHKVLRYRFNSTQDEFDKTKKSMFLVAKELHSASYVEFKQQITHILENSKPYKNKPESIDEVLSLPSAIVNSTSEINQAPDDIFAELPKTDEDTHDIAAMNYVNPKTQNDQDCKTYIKCHNEMIEFQLLIVSKLSREEIRGITEEDISRLLYNDGKPWEPTEASKLKERVEQVLSMQVVSKNLENILLTRSSEFIDNFKQKLVDLLLDFVEYGKCKKNHEKVLILTRIRNKLTSIKKFF